MEALDRFLSNTERVPGGCLMWTGPKNPKGYGIFWDGKRQVLAHRWIFIEKYGFAPKVVRHDCDTPSCVDWVGCLLPGSQADNIRDAVDRRRFKGMGDKCQRGHSDWGVQANGSRWCLECKRMRERKYRWRRRGESC